jgi:hypothetical protein
MNMKHRAIIAAGVAAASLSLGGPVQAQGMLPTIIGNTVAQSIEEDNCQDGRHPVAREVWDRDAAAIERQVASYAAAASAGDTKALRKLLGGGIKPVWKDPNGAVTSAQIHDPFTGGAPATVTRMGLVIGDDGASARGAWRFERTDPAGGAPLVYTYTVDFMTSYWSGAWKMRAMRLSIVEDVPALPPRFCHLAEAPALM